MIKMIESSSCPKCGSPYVRHLNDNNYACNNCNSQFKHIDPTAYTHRVGQLNDYCPFPNCGLPINRKSSFRCTKCGIGPMCMNHRHSGSGWCNNCAASQIAYEKSQAERKAAEIRAQEAIKKAADARRSRNSSIAGVIILLIIIIGTGLAVLTYGWTPVVIGAIMIFSLFGTLFGESN